MSSRHILDPQTGDVIHCEDCGMYPATHERMLPDSEVRMSCGCVKDRCILNFDWMGGENGESTWDECQVYVVPEDHTGPFDWDMVNASGPGEDPDYESTQGALNIASSVVGVITPDNTLVSFEEARPLMLAYLVALNTEAKSCPVCLEDNCVCARTDD